MRLTRVISILTILLIGIGLMSIIAVPVTAGPDCGDVDWDGDGSEEDPYEIGTAEELQCLSEEANENYHWVLVDDIDLSDSENWNDGEGFETIASGANNFNADSFDGQNHTISNLHQVDDREEDDTRYFGLFGTLNGLGQDIENIRIEDIHIEVTDNNWAYAGGLSAEIDDSSIDIDNVHVTGEIDVQGTSQEIGGLVGNTDSGTTITNATTDVDINTDTDDYVGGLVGEDSDGSSIEYVSSHGNITATDSDAVGGLIGRWTDSDISYFYSTADVTGGEEYVGGAVGDSLGGMDVEEGFAAGSVTAADGANVGGIWGDSGTGDYTAVYWDTEATGQDDSGDDDVGEEYGLTTEEMQGDAAESNMDELDYDGVWQTNDGYYPTLQDAPEPEDAEPDVEIDTVLPFYEVVPEGEEAELFILLDGDDEDEHEVEWDFDDGTTITEDSDEVVSHTYDDYGVYNVTATVDDSTEYTELTVTSSPTANATITPDTIIEGDNVTFNASASEDSLSAGREPPEQLSVTDGLQHWLPFQEIHDDAMWGGTDHVGDPSLNDGVNTDTYAGYGTDAETRLATNINWEDEWTVSFYLEDIGDSTRTVFGTGAYYGLYIEDGNIYRVEGEDEHFVDFADTGYWQITHDGSGQWEYYNDGDYITSDDGSTVAPSSRLIIGPNQLGDNEQELPILLDDFRIYDRQLPSADRDAIADTDIDSGFEQAPDELNYVWEIDDEFASEDEEFELALSEGDYDINLTAIDPDGEIDNDEQSITVSSVVAPEIDNVEPEGSQNTRDVTISADISHHDASSDYPISVELERVNEQTGEVEILKETDITESRSVSYDATHDDTGSEDYDVENESFSYQWIATEPQENLTTTSDVKRYDIPVGELYIENVGPEGTQSNRDVTITADITTELGGDVDVTLERYSAIEDDVETLVETTITDSETVEYNANHEVNESTVPELYDATERYSYVWTAESDTGVVRSSDTKEYGIPGLLYVVNHDGQILSDETEVNGETSTDGIHDLSDLANVADDDDYESVVTADGYTDAGIYFADFRRSYTAMLYDEEDEDVFEQTFRAGTDGDFQLTDIDADESYLVVQKQIDGTVYGVAKEPFDASGEADVTLRDGDTYQLSVYDGQDRRTIGSWTADEGQQDESQQVDPAPVDIDTGDDYEWTVSSEHNETDDTGLITFEFVDYAGDIENLEVDVINDDTNEIVFRDTVSGNVTDYAADIDVDDVNTTYTVEWRAYHAAQDETISSSRTVTIAYTDVLDELPDWVTTFASILLIIILGGILGMVSAPFGLFFTIGTAGVLWAIGWLPISSVILIQAFVFAIIYYASRSDI